MFHHYIQKIIIYVSTVSCVYEPQDMTYEHLYYTIMGGVSQNVHITDSYNFSVKIWEIYAFNITFSEKM